MINLLKIRPSLQWIEPSASWYVCNKPVKFDAPIFLQFRVFALLINKYIHFVQTTTNCQWVTEQSPEVQPPPVSVFSPSFLEQHSLLPCRETEIAQHHDLVTSIEQPRYSSSKVLTICKYFLAQIYFAHASLKLP